jgi:hypothetical protein
MSQPQLHELFASYLQHRGAMLEPEHQLPDSEVELHQAIAPAVVDARQAFKDAVAVTGWLLDSKTASALQASLQPLPGWASLVHHQESLVAVPFCLGNYPQMVHDVAPLLSGQAPSTLLFRPGRSQSMSDVATWAAAQIKKQQWADALLAAAVLRVAGQYDSAANLLQRVREAAAPAWDGLLRNEEAALEWSRGDLKRAGQLWAAHPGAATPPLLFNRGVAALFGDQNKQAAPLLQRAVELLPDTSAWHHLAHLYLALAEQPR